MEQEREREREKEKESSTKPIRASDQAAPKRGAHQNAVWPRGETVANIDNNVGPAARMIELEGSLCVAEQWLGQLWWAQWSRAGRIKSVITYKSWHSSS